jgi:Ca2+/H+ antiporter
MDFNLYPKQDFKKATANSVLVFVINLTFLDASIYASSMIYLFSQWGFNMLSSTHKTGLQLFNPTSISLIYTAVKVLVSFSISIDSYLFPIIKNLENGVNSTSFSP